MYARTKQGHMKFKKMVTLDERTEHGMAGAGWSCMVVRVTVTVPAFVVVGLKLIKLSKISN